MISGVVIPAVLPMALNTTPVRPMSSIGAASATTGRPSEPKPLPKKAGNIRPITIQSESTKLQPIMLAVSTRPMVMGILRAMVSEPVRLSSQSVTKPVDPPLMKPAMAGTEAMKPAFRMEKPQSLTR